MLEKYYSKATNVNLNYVFQPDPESQPITWKGEISSSTVGPQYQSDGPGSIVGVTPTSSQPQNNKSNLTSTIYDRSFRGATTTGRYSGLHTIARGKRGPLNPIKHWRKQLQPSQGHITGKAQLNKVMWSPGGSVYLGTTDTSCCSQILNNYLVNYFVDNSNCNCRPGDVIRNELSNFQPVTFNDPAKIILPRSSQTILKKNYYTTGRAYLRSRVKLYEQNQLLSKIAGNVEPPNPKLPPAGNNYVYPSSELTTGTQAFHSTYCVSDPSACCTEVPYCQTYITYKPNNPFFSVQGAVDSSTRILQAKYAAITKNNYDLALTNPVQVGVGLQVHSIAGDPTSSIITLPGSTPSKYLGDSYRGAAPYFIKSKYQQINACYPLWYQVSTHSKTRINGRVGNRMPSGGTGLITVCSYSSNLM